MICPGLRLGDGQRNGARCSGSGPAAARGDVATVGIHESFRDGKPNSCTAVFAVAGSVDSVEALENVGEVLGGYPVAGVGDRDRDSVLVGRRKNVHVTARRGMA